MTDEQSTTLFLNHTHTPYSNRITEQRDDTGDCVDHHTDYIDITERLPTDISIVYNRTEHLETETDLYDDIKEAVEGRGGEYRQFERHVWFKIDGTEAAIINSVEASVEQSNWHYTINGLPIGEKEYSQISEDELYQAAKDAAWTAPAHPFIPEFQLPQDQLHQFYQAADEHGFTAAINYSTGYSPLVNRLAQGHDDLDIGAIDTIRRLLTDTDTPESGSDVHQYAETYDIHLIPEHDTHAALPDRLDGAGVLDDIMDDLRHGDLPTDKLLNADILSYDGPGQEGLSWKRFLQTFPGSIPYSQLARNTGLLPVTEDDYSTVMERSMDSLADIDPVEIAEHTYDPEEQT